MVARLGRESARSFHRRYDRESNLLCRTNTFACSTSVYFDPSLLSSLGCPFQRIDRFRKSLMPIQRRQSSDTEHLSSGRSCLRTPGNDRMQASGYVEGARGEEAHCVEAGPQCRTPATVDSGKARA